MVKRVKCFAIVIAIVFIVFTPFLQAAPVPESLKDTYQKALDSDPDAQYVMGRFYLKKESPGADAEAEKWFGLAAAQNHAEAMYWLGKLFSKKPESPENDTRIVQLYRRAAELGIANAQYELGLFNLYGSHGLNKNIGVAQIRFRQAAAKNHIMSTATLVAMAHHNQCDLETGKASLKKMETWAKRGIAPAQYNLGQIHEYGYIVPQSYEKAVMWYEKAAPKGMIQAYLHMGYIYKEGLGLKKDYQKALENYEAAASKGNVSANYHVGQMYEKGLGVKKNDTTAARCYELAALFGHLGSMSKYGIMLAEGKGVTKNEQEALIWLMPAAAKGDAHAQFYLGRMYQKGIINADLEERDKLKKWVKLVRGQYHDAKVHANERVARQLFEKAAAQGHQQAIDYLEGERSFKGWFFLIFGACVLPISVGIFIWPEVAATLPRRGLSLPHHPLIIRFLSAPLLFLFAFALIYYGVQALGWFG
jgi:TPR repeat protein